MIIPGEKQTNVVYKRKKKPQVSSSALKLILREKVIVAMNKKVESHSIENISMNVKTPGEPLVKHHVEPNIEASTPTSSKAHT